MHGPERLGCILFSLRNLQEHEAPPESAESSGGFHTLRISGELYLGITRRRHWLPTNMWDRHRSGGRLTDGMTRVSWNIHDQNMPGRDGERYFDVIFSRRNFSHSITDQRNSFARWRDLVRREWSEYLSNGRRDLRSQIRREHLVRGWETEIMATLR